MPELVTALAAPAPDAAAEMASSPTKDSSLAATDVKIKRKKRAAAAKPAPASPLPSNADKLLKHLKYVLKTKGFAPVNQTAVAKATGIPLGSMTASLKRLVAAGRLQANDAGQFRLV